ncbi:MAG TPA: exodeoxyribonuclease VII small subunit [Candidatus Nanopelagicales bacterium]|nr:exodeoxyribonuclease VII small subunit [Candidatus Nanopelagicales bacterium]
MSTSQSFEQAREELASIVASLEAGGLSLEESLRMWEQGEKAAAVCTQWLDQAREKLAQAAEQISQEDAT